MKNFEEFMLDWWENFISEASDELCDDLMLERVGDEHELSDLIPEEAPDSREWLRTNLDDAHEIYTLYFGNEGGDWCKALPKTQELLTEMFSQASCHDHSFTTEFIENMAYYADGYPTPDGFFKDLAYGGCVSGMVGMLIYNSDCKEIYAKHFEDMEEFKEELEGDMGEPIRNERKLPHHTFLCWLCYEELAYQIGRNLFPNFF